MTLSLPSPAKINHFLHITGKRADGYHLLETVFQFLDYSDTLHFTPANTNTVKITSDNSNIPLEENLIYRAAMALKQHAQINKGVTIHLDKQLPLGSGLGGGSSNAATTLIALNELWQLYWPLNKLLELGVTLGADVPIFLLGHSAFAQGIGEILTPVTLHESWVLVAVPPCQISSAKMYALPELTRDTPRLRIGALAQGEIARAELKNDFEPVVRKNYPEVDATIKWLSNYGQARLSGSGASVFACFDTRHQAEQVARSLPDHYFGSVTQGVNISPMRQIAEKLGFSVYNASEQTVAVVI